MAVAGVHYAIDISVLLHRKILFSQISKNENVNKDFSVLFVTFELRNNAYYHNDAKF